MSTTTSKSIPTYGEVKELISTRCINAIHYAKSKDTFSSEIFDEIRDEARQCGIIDNFYYDATISGLVQIDNYEDISYCGIPAATPMNPTRGYLHINMFDEASTDNKFIANLSYIDDNQNFISKAVIITVKSRMFNLIDENGTGDISKAKYDWDVIAYLIPRK